MRDVVVSQRAIAIEHARRVVPELRPVGVGGLVDGFRPSVGTLEQQTVLEATVYGGLQRVIDAVRPPVPLTRRGRTAELREERASFVARARDLRRVDVQEGEAADGSRPHVSNRRNEFARQCAFADQVPRLDVASVQLRVGTRIARFRHAWQRYTARADIGTADRRDADVRPERSVGNARGHIRAVGGDWLETVDAGERRHQGQWIPPAQRLRAPRMRVVGDAIAGSDDGLVVRR